MAKYLDSTGVTLLWNKFKNLLSTKANIEDLPNVIAEKVVDINNEEINAVTIEQAKKALFIDMWNRRGDYNLKDTNKKDWLIVAKYDPENAPDADHVFYINKLWLTYEEALDVHEVPTAVDQANSKIINYSSAYSRAKTLFPKKSGLSTTLVYYMFSGPQIETLRILSYYHLLAGNNPETYSIKCEDTSYFAWGCPKLKEVIGIIELVTDYNNVHFYNTGEWPLLETLWLKGIKYNIIKSRYWTSLKVECWQFMIDNAANTSAITIVVPSTVLAKMTDSTNTEWNKVYTDAQAKNITFTDAVPTSLSLEDESFDITNNIQ